MSALFARVFLALGFVSALCCQAQAQGELEKGALAFKIDFDERSVRDKWSEAPFASWVKDGKGGETVLKVSVPPDAAPGHFKVSMPVDLKPYEGMKLWFRCLAKAKDVTKPPQGWNGVKWMLHYKAGGKDFYQNQGNVFGSFDWKELSFTQSIESGVQSAELVLGLESCVGEASFYGLEAVIARPRLAARPAPPENPPPAFKGHELPRLRGAMSPNQFKKADFELFGGAWNANLVRWQMTRRWGQANTDLDLEEYSSWIASEMEDLDKLLAAALEFRFKVVIDLHSPPGGRYEDNSMRMFYERKYNDFFVEVWKRFASRYKGHPAVWGYDLVNEPVEGRPPPEGMDYLSTQVRAAKALRQIDPKTAIMIEACDGDSPRAFQELSLVDVPNVVYQVHMYEPGAFTHQGVHSNPTGVTYPGEIGKVFYDKEKLRSILKPVRDFQLACNVHIYVGEFSAARWAPGAAKYLSDCIEIFEEYGWDWSYHAFREWDGWSLEHGPDPADHKPSAAPTDRLQLMLDWFKRNQKPVY